MTLSISAIASSSVSKKKVGFVVTAYLSFSSTSSVKMANTRFVFPCFHSNE
jgi:hypothetical protein